MFRQNGSIAESFIQLLVEDVIVSRKRWNRNGTQQNSRDLIRTTFAAVEGLAWHYREHVVSVARDVGSITQEEEQALSEIGYIVNEQGKISKQVRFIPLIAMIRLTTRMAVAMQPELQFRFDTVGWEGFRQAIQIRNRVTHPKRSRDMEISPVDVSTCLTGFYWLLEIATTAMGGANAALKTQNSEFQRLINALKAGDPIAWAEYNSAKDKLSD
jgi:hypothetical protein